MRSALKKNISNSIQKTIENSKFNANSKGKRIAKRTSLSSKHEQRPAMSSIQMDKALSCFLFPSANVQAHGSKMNQPPSSFERAEESVGPLPDLRGLRHLVPDVADGRRLVRELLRLELLVEQLVHQLFDLGIFLRELSLGLRELRFELRFYFSL